MKHLVEYPLEEGGSIVIEVDEPESVGTRSLASHKESCRETSQHRKQTR